MCAKSLKGAKHIGEVIADAPEHVENYKEGFLLVEWFLTASIYHRRTLV